jgi:hypothetical protein
VPFVADWRVVLRDLIALREIRIEVVLAGELRSSRDSTLQRQAQADRKLDNPVIKHRKRPRMPEGDRVNVYIGLRTESGGLGAERLAFGLKLAMNLESDDRLVLVLEHSLDLMRLCSAGRGHGVVAILFVLTLFACGRESDGPLFQSDAAAAPDLGDEYRFATAARETSPDEPPVIENDSLHVWVRYLGGCEDHVFRLGHRTSGDTAEIWLRHDARGDDCEEDFVERLSFRLPDPVLARENVRLVDPESDRPLIVNR